MKKATITNVKRTLSALRINAKDLCVISKRDTGEVEIYFHSIGWLKEDTERAKQAIRDNFKVCREHLHTLILSNETDIERLNASEPQPKPQSYEDLCERAKELQGNQSVADTFMEYLNLTPEYNPPSTHETSHGLKTLPGHLSYKCKQGSGGHRYGIRCIDYAKIGEFLDLFGYEPDNLDGISAQVSAQVNTFSDTPDFTLTVNIFAR